MFQLTILGSGSSGNCALITAGNARLLIDAGLSAREITARLAAVGVEPAALTAVMLTHEHGDHTRGLRILTQKHELPILCNAMTREVLRDSMGAPRDWRIVPTGGDFDFAGVEIATFSVPHDAVDPMGFVLRHGDRSLGVLSDVGHVTGTMRSRLSGVDTLFIEANYDDGLLASDTKRPWSTKQRISSRHGHLSNAQTAEFVAELATDRLERVLLGHLSRDCNHPDLASACVLKALRTREWHAVEVHCARPDAPTPWYPVRLRLPLPAPPTETPPVVPAITPPAAPLQTFSWRQMELL